MRGEGVGAAGQTAGAAETETGCARIRHSVPDAGGKSAECGQTAQNGSICSLSVKEKTRLPHGSLVFSLTLSDGRRSRPQSALSAAPERMILHILHIFDTCFSHPANASDIGAGKFYHRVRIGASSVPLFCIRQNTAVPLSAEL